MGCRHGRPTPHRSRLATEVKDYWKNYDAKSVRFSPDGKRIALTTNRGMVKVYDTVTGKLLNRSEGGNRITGAKLSPDGKWLAAYYPGNKENDTPA